MTVPLLLSCPVGLEDLVRGDLRDRDGAVSIQLCPGLIRLAESIDRNRLPAMVDRVALPLELGRDWSAAEIAEQLREFPWQELGLGSGEPIAFRVHLPGAGEQHRRDGLIGHLVEELGWSNEPSNWSVNIDVSTDASDAGARVELGPWAWAARYGTFERQPATTPGPVAAGLLRMAKLREGDTLLDVCGGVGTVPVVDGLQRSGRTVSLDNDAASVAAARRNVESHDLADRVEVLEADATDLPLVDESVDRVVSDLPFGKRIGSNELNKTLYPAILREIERVLTADGRCVLLSDDKRVFTESVAKARGLKVSGERVIRYNGVTPTAYVVRRSRRPKKKRS